MAKQKKVVTHDDITLEASLLNALATKRNYEQFITHIDIKRLIPATQELLKDYERYYTTYDSDIAWDVFYTDFVHNWHAKDLDELDVAYYRDTVFPLIRNSRIENVFTQLLQKEASEKIKAYIEKGDTNAVKEILTELEENLSAHEGQGDSRVFEPTDVDLTKLDTSGGVEWFLPKLQAGLGSLMGGQFVVVAADSDTGKSAFCISQAVHALKNMQSIFYCSSEDTQEDLMGRVLSNLYKDNLPNGFEDVARKQGAIRATYTRDYPKGLFRAMQIKSINDVWEIEKRIDKYKPRLIIIDMIDKLSASDTTQDLTPLYQRIRGWANSGYPIIGTTQSGNTSYQDKETGEYKKRRHLTDKDMANSKSGKQGAAYCSIMIGVDPDVKNIRYVDTTKKKRGKHVSVTCTINDMHSLYQELM